MSEKKKKKKKAPIITGLVGSVGLIGGGIGISYSIPKTETKIEESEEEVEIEKAPVVGTPQGKKTNLNTKIQQLWLDVLFDATKTNQELDSIILADIHLNLWLNPKLVNPEIKYFGDAKGKIDVSNRKQQAGDLYVVIIANDDDDLNYKGSTNPIKISLKKYKLSDITQLSGLNLTADSNKKFEDFNDEIEKTPEFKINPLKNQSLTIYYFESESDNWPIILNKMKQRKDTFWITIQASGLESNWYGETPKIKIIVN